MVKRVLVLFGVLAAAGWSALLPSLAFADTCTERASVIYQGKVPITQEDPDCDRGNVIGAIIAWGAAAATAITAVGIGLGAAGVGGVGAATGNLPGVTATSGSLPGAPAGAPPAGPNVGDIVPTSAIPGPGIGTAAASPPSAEPITSIRSGQPALHTLQTSGLITCDTAPDGSLINCRPNPGFGTLSGGKPVDQVVGQAIDPATGKPTYVQTQTTTEISGIAFHTKPDGTLDPNIAIVVNQAPPTGWIPVPPPTPTVTTTVAPPPAPSGSGATTSTGPVTPPGGTPTGGTTTGGSTPGGGTTGGTTPPGGTTGQPPPSVKPTVPPPPIPQQMQPLTPPATELGKPGDSGSAPPAKPGGIPPDIVKWAEATGRQVFSGLSPEEQKAILQTAQAITNKGAATPVSFNSVDDLVKHGRARADGYTASQAQDAYRGVQSQIQLASLAREVFSGLSLLPGLDERINALMTKTANQLGVPPDAVKAMLNMDDDKWDKVMAFQNELAQRLGVKPK